MSLRFKVTYDFKEVLLLMTKQRW